MTEFLRMSGIYWGVTALDLLGHLDKIDKISIIEFIKKCQCPTSGGISPCEGHDPHILYTLSAVQVSYYGLRLHNNIFCTCPVFFFFFVIAKSYNFVMFCLTVS